MPTQAGERRSCNTRRRCRRSWGRWDRNSAVHQFKGCSAAFQQPKATGGRLAGADTPAERIGRSRTGVSKAGNEAAERRAMYSLAWLVAATPANSGAKRLFQESASEQRR